MKISIVQGVLAMALGGVALAHPHHAQILERTVTLHVEEVSLDDALTALGKEARIQFIYSATQIDVKQAVSLAVSRAPLGTLLRMLLEERQIAYRVYEEEGVITLWRAAAPDEHLEPVAVFAPSSPEDVVTGKVTDALTGMALPGVNVIVKGSTNGTSTDGEGQYRIKAEPSDVLVFSFIGYTSVEVAVGARLVIDILLSEDVKNLTEVVVNAGYWKVDDKERTGNIGKISAVDIEKQPVSNPLAALEGRIPGVYVQQTTGVPGGGFNVQIRGRNSLRADANYPLYIVDGVPYSSTTLSSGIGGGIISGGTNPLANLNPASIESITILKDADATAIYGSRGANGVVLITTKRGQAQKTKLDVNLYTGAGKVTKTMKMLNTAEYLAVRHEAFRNDGVAPGTFSSDADLLRWDTTRYTDWQKELIGGVARIHNAQVTLSGGNEQTQFSVGGGYFQEGTVFPGDFQDRKSSAVVTLHHTSTDRKLTVEMTSNYVADVNNLLGTDLTGRAVTLAPNAPALYDDNGNLNWENSTWDNPLSYMKKTYHARTANLISNLVVDYAIAAGLRARVSGGYTTTQMDEVFLNPLSSYNPAQGITSGSSNFGRNEIRTWIVEPQVSYERKSERWGALTLLSGATLQDNERYGQVIRANGFSSDALLQNVQAASSVTLSNVTDIDYRYAAFFGRVHYNWADKYIVNLTGRRDGSSRFGPDKRFNTFGAIGAAWIFSQESFMKSVPFLSFGKLRASVGTTGNDQIPDYGYLDTFSTTSNKYNGDTGLIPTRLANPDYSWETNKKVEAGIELGFLSDALYVSASLYRNRSANQLVGLSLPASAGFATIQTNLPATIQNSGLEVELSARVWESNDWKWRVNANVTLPRNKLVEYPNLKGSPFANVYEEGKSLFVQKRLQAAGVDPATGVYRFEDADGSGSDLDYPGDLKVTAPVTQEYFGGLQSSLTYKQVTLDFLFQYVKQLGFNYLNTMGMPGTATNKPRWILERWQQAGDVATMQRFTQDYGSEAATRYAYSQYYSDNVIGDASFTRLKNLSLSYQFAGSWLERVRLEQMSVYVQGQNLLTFTRYRGMDPENQNTSALPPLRVVTIGLKITL